MSNPIDEYFKRNLANQEITPSKNLFADKIQPNIKQRKAAPFFFLRVAAALVLLLAGWMVVQMLNRPEAGNDRLYVPYPVAVEEEVAPASTPQVVDETPAETKNISIQNVPSNAVAVQQKDEAPKKQQQMEAAQKLELEETPVVLAAVETEPHTVVVSQPITAEAKKTYRVKIKIDPAKYATATPTSNDVAQATPTLKEYAKNQITSVKEGEGLQAPPKEWFDLPKLAVKFEGNPLKRVLQN